MLLRAASLTVLLIGLLGPVGPAMAQYYPVPPRAAYPPYRSLPPIEADDEDATPPIDQPSIYSRPGQPESYGQPPRVEALPSPGTRYGHQMPAYPEEVEPYAPPPPGFVYREPPRGYEPVDPRMGQPGMGQPGYGAPPPYGAPPATVQPPGPQDAMRPPMSIGPDQDAVTSALPPDDRPETGPIKELPPQFRRTTVDYRTKEPAGSIVIDTPNTYLYLVLGGGKAMRYGIGVGREGFTWTGAEKVSRMAEWPDWHPPAEMIERQPYLPRFMAGGPGNPLGARALYLGQTLYRIHGTNQPSTIGTFVSSGCIRLTNEDVADLYTRVKVGTRVVVLPGRPPATASAAPIAPQADAAGSPGPYNPLAAPGRH